jgi:hypothetical protein
VKRIVWMAWSAAGRRHGHDPQVAVAEVLLTGLSFGRRLMFPSPALDTRSPAMRFPLACILLFVAAYVAVSGTPANAIDIFVAPGGDDANAGTQDKPLATITKARDAVRQLIAAGLKSDVHVYLCAGVYRLKEPNRSV